jgi:hypothetical protein
VVQQLAEGDGGSVGASRAVVEPVDDVAGEVAAGGLVEPAAALLASTSRAVAVIILVTLAIRKATSASKPPRSSRWVVAALVQPSGRRGVSTRSRQRWTPGSSRPAAVMMVRD